MTPRERQKNMLLLRQSADQRKADLESRLAELTADQQGKEMVQDLAVKLIAALNKPEIMKSHFCDGELGVIADAALIVVMDFVANKAESDLDCH